MHPSNVIIGLDVGTTAVKAVAFGIDVAYQHVEERTYTLESPLPGFNVQDPEAIWTASLDALKSVVRAIGGARIDAISVSTAMHGLIALDERRRLLTPLVTWADGRASDVARELHDRGLATALHRETGAPVHSQFPLAKIMWFRRHEPEVFARTRWWIGLKDFILMRLSGQLVTEHSSASGTGMLSMATMLWSPAALDLCEIDEDRLPEITSTTSLLSIRADVATDLGIPADTRLVAGAADGPLANLGIGAMSRGELGLSVGTSGAARIVVDSPSVDDEGALFCYALTENCWVLGSAISNGGVVAQWAGETLAPELSRNHALLELAAAAPPGCDGLRMLPYLLPERGPLWDPSLSGAYLGLRSTHTRAHMIRAAVEGVCLHLAAIVRILDTVEPIASIRATGGAFRSRLVSEIMAAAMGRRLHVVSPSEGSALGAAALGLFAIGEAADLEVAARVLNPDARGASVIEPDPELVDCYARVAASIPDAIEALQKASRIFRR